AILSVTVPETIMRSACRGPLANGITPNRMKSWRLIEVAMNSIAQQASPKLNTQSEYRLPQFRTNFIGLGASLAAGPIVGRSLTAIRSILLPHRPWPGPGGPGHVQVRTRFRQA